MKTDPLRDQSGKSPSCGVAWGTCPVSLLKCPQDEARQPEESDLVEQGLVADFEPTCGAPTVPASSLQTSAERASWRETSFSPNAAGPAVSSLARATHRAPTTGRFDKAVALVSCAPSCSHIHTIARRPRQARAPRPEAKVGSCPLCGESAGPSHIGCRSRPLEVERRRGAVRPRAPARHGTTRRSGSRRRERYGGFRRGGMAASEGFATEPCPVATSSIERPPGVVAGHRVQTDGVACKFQTVDVET